jgi:hypothetical protein
MQPVIRAVLLLSCVAAPAAANVAGAPAGDWELFHALVEAGELEVHAPAGPLTPRLERAARELEARTDLAVSLVPAGETGEPSRPRVLLGSWDTPGMAPLLARLGVQRPAPPATEGFDYVGLPFVTASDALVAWFADPERPGLPVAVYFSEDPSALAFLVEDLMPAASSSVVCYAGGIPVVEGTLDPAGRLRGASVVDRRPDWTTYKHESQRDVRLDVRVVRSEGFGLTERFAESMQRVRAARLRLFEWIPHEGRSTRLELHLHTHLDDKLRLTGDPALVTVYPSRDEVHALVANGVPDALGVGVTSSVLHRWYGPAATSWIEEALPVAIGGTWWGHDLDALVGRVAAAGIVPSTEELLDPAADILLSPHLRAPLRALLATVAIEDGPAGVAAALWSGAPLGPDVEPAFRSRIEAARERFERDHRRRGPSVGFRSGIALEPSGRPGSNGYASRDAARTLEMASAAGADAVALSTFAFLRRPWPALPSLPLSRRRAATQCDEALAQAAAEARARSMRLLLEPHLLTSPGGVLAGSAAWNENKDWRAFFDDYERFLVHYGLLAELLGAEILCVGAELSASVSFRPEAWRALVDHERLRAKRERWIELIDVARGMFDGGLTYAAESSRLGRGAEDFELWEALDFVSTAFFQPVYRVSSRPQYVLRLEDEIGALFRLARRVKRPLLLLPIGFRSSEQGAARPDSRAGTADAGMQLELYRGLAEVLRGARARNALAGFFLWSFSTDPNAGGAGDAGFTPQGKPAEAILPLLFGQ